MKKTELAEFHRVSVRQVARWSAETLNAKEVQYLAGAEPEITGLIGEINQLAYIFDCQHLQGVNQVKWCHVSRLPYMLTASIHALNGEMPLFRVSIDMLALDVAPKLTLLRNTLRSIVYDKA